MKKTAGIIFSNIHDQELPELTRMRTMASVPIAARYRLIDFTLSSMVNAGVTQIGIICKTNYHSLLKHVGSGKDWDLDRKNDGVTIISPFVEAGNGPLYENRLEAMQNALRYLRGIDANNVILSDCDILANIPYDEILKFHEENDADITAVYKKINYPTRVENYNMEFVVEEGTNEIKQVAIHNELQSLMNHGMNIYVIRRQVLTDMINDSLIYGYKSFSRELFPLYLNRVKVLAYEFKGYGKAASSLNSYFEANMDLLDPKIRAEIFHQEDKPIMTRILDSAPSIYGEDAVIENSLISDGCVIEGTVVNSIISRGVRVDEGAVVKNSIILSDTIIESGTNLNYIIADKNVFIRRGKTIAGCEGYPFFVASGSVL